MAGAQTVGRLVIDLAADVAQLRSDMATATGIVESTGATIQSAARAATAALGVLGVAFSVGEIKNWSEGVISAAANLEKLSGITGSSVESLSRLSNIAKVTGTDFGTFNTMLSRLSVGMGGVEEGTSKAARALEFLGITTRDPAAALEQIAVELDKYADGVGKAAIARDLFGKTGPQFLEALKAMADGMGVAATVTREQAVAAEQLEKQWALLGVQSTMLKNVLLSEVVPALLEIVVNFNLARAAGLGFWGSLQVAGIDSSQNLQPLIGALRDRIKELNEQLEYAEKFKGKGFLGPIVANIDEDTKKLNAVLAVNSASIMRWANSLGDMGDQVSRAFQTKPVLDYSSAIDKTLTQAKSETADYTVEIQKLQQILDNGDGKMTKYDEAINKITADMLAGKIVVWDDAEAFLAAARAVDADTEARKGNIAALKEWTDQQKTMEAAMMSWQRVQDAAIAKGKEWSASLRDAVDASNDEIATFGLSADALRNLNQLRDIDAKTRREVNELRRLGLGQLADEKQAEADAAKAAIEANNIRLSGLREWQSVLTDVAHAGADFIIDFVNNGSDAFKRLWQRFRDWALEALAEIAAKQIVVSIVGALGLGGSVGAQAAGAIPLGSGANLLSSIFGGGGSGGGSILSNLGSFTGLGNLAGGGIFGAGGAMSGFATGNIGQALGLSSAGLDTAGGVALTGLGETVGAAIPVVGALFAAFSIAKALGAFGSKGGPMTREYGTAGGGLGDFGDLSSLHKLIGTDASQTTAYNTLAGGLLSSYQALARLLGVDPGSASFAVYASSDPKGTAPSNVDVRANVGGSQVYAGDNFNVGRSAADIEAEIKRQGQLAILNALKATDLPAIVKEFLGLVDLGTQTFEAITNAAVMLTKLPEELQRKFVDLLKLDPELFDQLADFNAAFVSLSAALDAGDEAVANFKDGVVETTESVYDKALRLNDGLMKLVGTYDGSTDQTNALASATNQYIGSMVAALQQITQIRQGLSTMFGDSIRQIDMAIMTTVERSAFLKNEALQNIDLLKKTTDPAQIDKLSKVINTDLMTVFNMLSPEEQKRQHQWFVDRLTESGNTADAQLVKSGNNLTNVLDIIGQKLSNAATMQYNAAVAFGVAAGTISESAAQMLIAANTPVTVNTEVTVDVKKDQPEDNVTVTTGAPIPPDLVADGGWGWMANPDPNVIHATPGA